MMYNLICGNSLDVLKTLPDGSVQCVVTSPPYYGLRDYGVAGQIGLEQTPEAYVNNLVAVFRECWRVMKDDGTLWLNLGDSYASQPAGNKTPSGFSQIGGKRDGNLDKYNTHSKGWGGAKQKDLLGIPWMVAFALRSDGWYLRSDIVWHKPNPMPESVTDRPTKAHEYIFLLSKSAKYYYDADAVREELATPIHKPGNILHQDKISGPNDRGGHSQWEDTHTRNWGNPAGRNRRSVWTVTTKPYKGAHFATFPPDLIVPCILAGSRIGDTVLDPFNGSGTTGEVSLKNGRGYIGIELNPKYIQLSQDRLRKYD